MSKHLLVSGSFLAATNLENLTDEDRKYIREALRAAVVFIRSKKATDSPRTYVWPLVNELLSALENARPIMRTNGYSDIINQVDRALERGWEELRARKESGSPSPVLPFDTNESERQP